MALVLSPMDLNRHLDTVEVAPRMEEAAERQRRCTYTGQPGTAKGTLGTLQLTAGPGLGPVRRMARSGSLPLGEDAGPTVELPVAVSVESPACRWPGL